MMDIAAASWWEILLRLILALVLGGLIGLERETVEKPAGLRTHTLVTLGAALFTLISQAGFFGAATAARPAAAWPPSKACWLTSPVSWAGSAPSWARTT